MEAENRIKMTDAEDTSGSSNSTSAGQQGSSDDAPNPSSLGEEQSGPPGDTPGNSSETDVQAKVQEVMAKGKESGVIGDNAEGEGEGGSGNIQDQIKDAVSKGQAPGGVLNGPHFIPPQTSPTNVP
jgi:hypothetical protein